MNNLKRGAIKAYKDYLNSTVGFTTEAKGQAGGHQYHATKRTYGDYLYSQDKAMFIWELQIKAGLVPDDNGQNIDPTFKAIYDSLS